MGVGVIGGSHQATLQDLSPFDPAAQILDFFLIDGRKVVELDVLCARDAWKADGVVALAKGHHHMTVEYFQAADRMSLELSCGVNGGPAVRVSPSMLFHAVAEAE